MLADFRSDYRTAPGLVDFSIDPLKEALRLYSFLLEKILVTYNNHYPNYKIQISTPNLLFKFPYVFRNILHAVTAQVQEPQIRKAKDLFGKLRDVVAA